MASQPPVPRSGSGRRRRREQRRRARDIRRVTVATVFVFLEIAGFWTANFADRDSWTELTGFLLLQPVQIVLNLIDSHFQLTRGMRDPDAVLLVTMLSLPLNVLFWYVIWRSTHRLRRKLRKLRLAPGSAYGPAPSPPRHPRTPVVALAPNPSASLAVSLAPTGASSLPEEEASPATNQIPEATLRK